MSLAHRPESVLSRVEEAPRLVKGNNGNCARDPVQPPPPGNSSCLNTGPCMLLQVPTRALTISAAGPALSTDFSESRGCKELYRWPRCAWQGQVPSFYNLGGGVAPRGGGCTGSAGFSQPAGPREGEDLGACGGRAEAPSPAPISPTHPGTAPRCTQVAHGGRGP